VSTLGLNTPLRDLLDIPETRDASDFVLRLHEGVAAPTRTLQDYVVTEAIAKSLDDALALVERTLNEGKSKGTFIHGSFGSGKSHFMAVLHLLLTGNVAARELPGLQQTIASRSSVFGRKLLAIDYHLLGAESFEQALFSGYLNTVRDRYPEHALPVLHASDGLFADAQQYRQRLGDDGFFAAINEQSGGDWGDVGTMWDADTFDAALRLPAGHSDRSELAQTLMATILTGYANAGDWLDISSGIKAMNEHARDLGYDGLILFLDELVLWLAQHLSDSQFIASETSKVAKLVETGMSTLPIPMVSFVARQRDLKDFLGGGGVGAEQEAIGQSIKWWDDRFEQIELQAADLPKIVKQRLLMPVSAEAEAVLKRALATVKQNSSSWGYLLTDEAGSNEGDFANVYPFSPALVDALVALSSLLQRERTALKLMGELLSDGRESLTASDVIPVGDLFDPVVLGTVKPLTEDMKRHFEVAADFYRNQMRPYLLGKHRVSEREASSLGRDHVFMTEDRLVKTLLIAELVPNASSLRNLTAARLAALNYGTINAYIPGTEAQQVLTWAQQWAQEFGEVSITTGADPIIALHLAGVDYTSILERVRAEDSTPNRRELIRGLIAEELGLDGGSFLVRERALKQVWRGQKRDVSVIFGNVRDAADVRDDDLIAEAGAWRLVIDFPYDDGLHSPSDDIARLETLRVGGIESNTIAWIPNFLNAARLDDIGKLVTLEYVLKPAQFEQNAGQLAPADREPARNALENQRRALRERVIDVLRQAYGVAAIKGNDVDPQLSGIEIFSTLASGLTIQPPVAVNLNDGLRSVLDQAWTHEHPLHPKIEPSEIEVRATEVKAAMDLVARASTSDDRRLPGLDTAAQKVLKRLAVPLRLGTLRENVFTVSLSTFGWRDDFTRWTANATNGVTVGQLRGFLAPWGMGTLLQDAVIMTWALLTDREWVRGTAIADAPAPGALTPDLLLRPANLPAEESWLVATARAQSLFGLPLEPHLVSGAVRRLGQAISLAATKWSSDTGPLVAQLEAHAAALGLDADAPVGRLATARRADTVLADLVLERDPRIIIEVLGAADLPAEAQAVARSITTARALHQQLKGADWPSIEASSKLNDAHVNDVLAEMQTVGPREELHASLQPALAEAGKAAREALIRLATVKPPAPVVPPVPVDPPVVPAVTGPIAVISDPVVPVSLPGPIAAIDEIELEIDDALDSRLQGIAEKIRSELAKNPGKRAHVRWWLE